MKIKPNHFSGMQEVEQIIKGNGQAYTVRKTRDRFFFPDEWMGFYDCLKGRQKITFNTLINTGARINEARNIKVSDIDFDRGNIVLRVTKMIVNRPGIDKKGKSKIRILSVSTKFIKFLRAVIAHYNLGPDDYLPILSEPAAHIAMRKALIKAGITDAVMFSPHNCRKTLETWLVALGVDSFKLVKYFGHSMAVALKHYVSPDIFSWEDKKQIREIIGDLFENRR